MAMREDKAELRARVFLLEKERATVDLKLNAREAQIAAQHAAIQHLQGQLSDTEAMLAMASNRVIYRFIPSVEWQRFYKNSAGIFILEANFEIVFFSPSFSRTR